jgi:hypothetical protein
MSEYETREAMWASFVKKQQYRRIAEVGVWKGEFARHLLSTCPSIESYTLIDSWRHLDGWNKPFNISDEEFEDVYCQAMDAVAFAREKVRVLRGTTLEVRDQIEDQSLDFAYIDGDHSLRGIVVDAMSMWPKLREGGVLAGDDFTDNVWQHSRQYEPSLVNPFMRYFADAVGEELNLLPNGQFFVRKSRARGAGRAPAASASYGLLPLLKLDETLGSKKELNKFERGVARTKSIAKAVVRHLSPRYREYEAIGRHGEQFPEHFRRTGIVFVHVPKAAGTSISMTLYGVAVGHRTLAKWQAMFPYSMRRVETMAVVRDPVARFVSAFNFLKAGGINDFDRSFALKHLVDFDEPSELASALIDPTWQARILTYPHFARQVDFLKNSSGKIVIDCLVRLENLADAEKWAARKLGRQLSFDLMNVGPKSDKQLIEHGPALSALSAIYREDFDLFGSLPRAKQKPA